MPTELDDLLYSVHPKRTLEAVARSVDEAVNAFGHEAVLITDFQELGSVLVRFHDHVVAHLGGIDEMPPGGADLAWGQCIQILRRAFGSSGEKAAMELARTGAEGGLYAVLKAVAKGLAERHAENEIKARIAAYWNDLSTEEKLVAPEEYIRKWGHLLPAETEGFAGRIRGDFVKVLQEHPHMVQRMGQAVRRR